MLWTSNGSVKDGCPNPSLELVSLVFCLASPFYRGQCFEMITLQLPKSLEGFLHFSNVHLWRGVAVEGLGSKGVHGRGGGGGQGLSQQEVWVSFGLPGSLKIPDFRFKKHPRFWYVFFINTNSKLKL